MRVLVAAASFSSSISGLQRHAFNMAQCLLQRPEVSALHLVVAPWQAHLLPAVGLTANGRLSTHIGKMTRSSLSRNFWYYKRLPELADALRADVVHLTFPMPVNAARFSCPTVVTLHDLYPYEIPQNFGFPKVFFNRVVLRQCLRSVDAIACVSEATSRTLQRYMPPAVWQKAVRVYNCVETASLCSLDSPVHGWRGEPFLLCVAQHRQNKNIPVAIHAFARLLLHGQIDSASMLIVVGMQGPETRRIRRLICCLGLGNRIRLLNGLSDAELRWCYAGCEAIVAPSITEGFGLPVAEALLAGCRVICSDIPAFREVGGTHCRYVTLGKDAEEMFAEAIALALRKPKEPPLSLPQFSASALAREYIGLYMRLLASPATSPSTRHSAGMRAAVPERSSL
jgi:glycosyltransferase involved in cell wall biosynthesis